ncbi:MAG: marine proteobacterial sortase target protein [Kiloniellales bacterium]|nr:marine proteobacterial sortase target protein [Kiloniellales bacterium]
MDLDDRQQDFARAPGEAPLDWAGLAQKALTWTARLTVTALFTILLVLSVRAAEAAPSAPAASAEAIRAGLFFKSGRPDAVLEAPTLASEVEIRIHGQVARVTVRQRFHNPSKAWLEGVYVFPLPERSAVDELIMTVGGRRVVGQVMEREAAKQVYLKAAREGRRAGLLASARPNVFVTSVANVGPGETVTIEIGYQDRIGFERGRMSYRFPMVVAPRFTPPGPEMVRALPTPLIGQPKARDIALQRETAAGGAQGVLGADLFGPVRHPDLGSANPLELRVSIDAGRPLADLESPSHPINIEAEGIGRARVTLARGSVPADRDFVLQWRPEVGREPEAALFAEEKNGSSYLLLDLLPPEAMAGASGPSEQRRDLVLVVDRSGSMHGVALDQAKHALALALDSLAPGDRFNILSFASDTRTLFRGSRPASEANLSQARRHITALNANGGTMMRPALVQALSEPPLPEYLRQVVFLTDGAVSNEHELFLDIAARLGESRLFTVGLGSAPNGYFMRRAAELGRGSFVTISNRDQVAGRMGSLFRKLEQPQVTDVAVEWPAPLARGVTLYPAVLPDLYADQPISLSARFEGRTLESLSGDLVVTARRGAALWRRTVSLAGLRPARGVAAIWARGRFADIQDGAYRGVDRETIRREAIPLALEHRLVTSYTSLVAVEAERTRPDDMALRRHEVARNLPAGMSFEKVFGEPEAVMPLRPVPRTLLRDAAFRGEAVALPQGATPAPVLLLGASVLFAFGAACLLAARRPRRRGA